MKQIYIIGFRGTSFRDAKYKSEHPLIRAGHVGIAFEGEEEIIYGFHPSTQAVEQAGGDEVVIEQLKMGVSFDGTIQIDTEVFNRADYLSAHGARTAVWQITLNCSEFEFNRIYELTRKWYTEGVNFPYAFPQEGSNTDNCATFPRQLGMTLPEPTGQLQEYVKALQGAGDRWKAKGQADVSNDDADTI
jgi:hypothetical protein